MRFAMLAVISLTLVTVLESPAPGQPGRILVFDDAGQYATYTFGPPKPPTTQPQAK